MKDYEYRALLDLLMCSDPYPVIDDGAGNKILLSFADDQAKLRGFSDWVDAYHRMNR